MTKSRDRDQDRDDLDLGLSTYSSNRFNSRRTHDANYKYLYYGSTRQQAQLHGPNHNHNKWHHNLFVDRDFPRGTVVEQDLMLHFAAGGFDSGISSK